jgi:TonB family protein
MARRTGGWVFTAVLLVASTDLSAQAQRPWRASGNRIAAGDGDVIVIDSDARVKIVRQREGNIRTIFSPTERWLVMLVDFATADGGPDGRVDKTYRYANVSGDWPMEDRWEGAATIEDYSLAADGPSGHGFVGPLGLVQMLGPLERDFFYDPAAISVLSYMGAGSDGQNRVTFDEAERAALKQVRGRIGHRSAQFPTATTSSLSFEVGTAGSQAPVNGGPVRVGGGMSPPKKISDVAAVMPEQAVLAGVKGVVVVEITIDTDGTVKDARLLRSIPLLDQAALDAVRQWRYERPLLNGHPVAATMVVTVPFQ